MRLETFRFTPDSGWSTPLDAALDSEQTLVLVFAAPELLEAAEPFQSLRDKFPKACVIGCSTSGEIFEANISDGSASVAVARFEHTTLRRESVRIDASLPNASFLAGEALAKALDAPDLRGVLVISDGLQINGSKLVEGINSLLGESIVVTGGLAGDGDRFQKTWILHEGHPEAGHVSALGLYGDRVRIGHGSKGGWDKFGPERVVSRSEGNVLYELDGKPALELYKTYLGERAGGLPATGLLFPLAFRSSTADDKSIVRTLLAVDEQNQSLTFAGDLPQGSLVQLMRANFDRLIEGASQAAVMTKANDTGDKDVLAVAISCVGRRLVLGERTEEEVEACIDVLPSGSKLIGFYSYGEISPYTTGRCDLHNQTMTLTTICEN